MQRDTCSAVANVYAAITRILMRHRGTRSELCHAIRDVLRKSVRKIREDELHHDEYFFVVRLNKNPDQYTNHPYKPVAKRMVSLGYSVKAHNHLCVLACVDPRAMKRAFVEEREYAQRPVWMIDHAYYIERCLYPRLEDLLCKKECVFSIYTLREIMELHGSEHRRSAAAPHPQPVLDSYTCTSCNVTTRNATLLVLERGAHIRYGLRCCNDKCAEDFDLLYIAGVLYDVKEDAMRTSYLQNFRDAIHFNTCLMALGLDADSAKRMGDKFIRCDPGWLRNSDTICKLLVDVENRLRSSPSKKRKHED